MTPHIAALVERLETRSTMFGSIPYGGSESVVDKQAAAALRSQAADIERLELELKRKTREAQTLANAGISLLEKTERLERERDEARHQRDCEKASSVSLRMSLSLRSEKLAAAEKDAAELRGALEPFVDRIASDTFTIADDAEIFVRMGWLRRARAACKGEGNG